jgi:anti-sigma-K factor RskA
MTPEIFRELLPLYVVGALDGEELEQFEHHIDANRARCGAELAEFQAVADNLAFSAPPVMPPDRVWRQIRAGIDPPQRAEREPFDLSALVLRWIPWTATAALAVLVIYLSHQLSERQGTLTALNRRIDALQAANTELAADKTELTRVANELRQKFDRQDLLVASLERKVGQQENSLALLMDPAIRVAQLADPKGETKAVAKAYWHDAKQTGLVVASHLPAVLQGQDKCLELWAIKAGEAPVPAGIFWTDETGHGIVEIRLTKQLASIDKFAVTIEPTGGVPAPSGPMVLIGD